jgi:acyl-coenzyme A thioesterase 13
MQAGKTMALIRGEITSIDGKIVYCSCEHHKVNVDTKADHKAVFEKMAQEARSKI